ncbi:MAG TPA: hypothetical protein VF590_04885 [Isosphaeraceae bacterium]|jgi:hypothetical protein
MLYTLTRPALQGDRILLYPSPDAAQARAGGRHPVIGVALRSDARGRRVVPAWSDPGGLDPMWSAPAEFHPDGSITAKGPIPGQLFLAS